MYTQLTAAMAPVALSTQGLVTYLQGLFGPLFLGIVGIVAIFFLFTREVTRFVQFIVLAVAIAVVFYTPSIVPFHSTHADHDTAQSARGTRAQNGWRRARPNCCPFRTSTSSSRCRIRSPLLHCRTSGCSTICFSAPVPR